MEERKRRRRKKKTAGRRILEVVCVLLVILAVLFASIFIVVKSLLGKINRKPSPTEPSYSAGELDATVPTESEIIVLDEDILNILLIGQDRREGEDAQRSDSMILCTLNKEKKTLTMTSFMRDMYVEIPGFKDNRINVAYAIGGADLLSKTIKHNFGIVVNHFVEVDVFSFIDIIDALGGVDMELTAKEAEYLNRRGNWDYSTAKGWTLRGGMNHMTGEQTVAYCRIRDIGYDFERTLRQRKVLTEVTVQMKSMGVFQAYHMLEKVLPNVTTNMSDSDILKYAAYMLPRMKDIEIVSLRIPTDDGYSDEWVDGMLVLMPNVEKNKQFLAEKLN